MCHCSPFVHASAWFSWNHGQSCCAGSRIFVQSGIYDEFLKRFTEKAKSLKLDDPFAEGSYQGPQVSKAQFDVGLYTFLRSGIRSH